MKKTNLLTVILLTTLAFAISSCKEKTPVFGEAPIEKIVEELTLEEKVDLLVGIGAFSGDSIAPEIRAAKEYIPGCAGATTPIARLGIPSIQLPDGPAGLRIYPTRQGDESTYYCTAFPVATMLASTWNRELIENVGKAIGDEVKQYGADLLLAPALNIHRHPLLGRTFEYFSEDPVVSGKVTAALVNGIQSNGVGATLKHFAFNNQETNRSNNDSRMSDRTAREIYLKGFEIAVKESNPWAVMTSYNKINGRHTAENKELIEGILREEWGFQGLVMTDWGGGKNAVAMVQSGNDLIMPGNNRQKRAIIEAVNNGTLSMDDINRNVTRILQIIEKSPKFNGYEPTNAPDLKANAQIALQSAAEGMVLLKNDHNVLPLSKKIKNIALYGISSYKFLATGTGSGSVNCEYVTSLEDGLEAAGYKIDPAIASPYRKHAMQIKPREARNFMQLENIVMPESLLSKPFKLRADAIANDVAIITIGRSCGESSDREYEGNYTLTQVELKMINDVCEAFHTKGKKVVVVLNIGAPIETSNWKNKPDAIIMAGLPGQEGGFAIADILNGKITPSGKLVDTFVKNIEDIPSHKNFPVNFAELNSEKRRNREKQIKNFDYTEYQEGLQIGYRYFDEHPELVSYPFGYGLSYTTFEYSNPTAKYENNELTLTITVKNTGNYSGKEAVQIYVTAPKSELTKPVKELKSFAKTAELKPGEQEVLEFTISNYDLASYNETAGAWVTESGYYNIGFAASAQDIRQTASFNIAQEIAYPTTATLQ